MRLFDAPVTAGPGDPETWGPYTGHPLDPRNPGPPDDEDRLAFDDLPEPDDDIGGWQ